MRERIADPDTLDTNEVMALTGMSRYAVHNKVRFGYFPPPIARGQRGAGRKHRWLKTEVLRWLRDERSRRLRSALLIKRGLDRLSQEMSP